MAFGFFTILYEACTSVDDATVALHLLAGEGCSLRCRGNTGDGVGACGVKLAGSIVRTFAMKISGSAVLVRFYSHMVHARCSGSQLC